MHGENKLDFYVIMMMFWPDKVLNLQYTALEAIYYLFNIPCYKY